MRTRFAGESRDPRYRTLSRWSGFRQRGMDARAIPGVSVADPSRHVRPDGVDGDQQRSCRLAIHGRDVHDAVVVVLVLDVDDREPGTGPESSDDVATEVGAVPRIVGFAL